MEEKKLPFIWKAKKNKAKSLLCGTMHFTTHSYEESIKKILEGKRVVLIENEAMSPLPENRVYSIDRRIRDLALEEEIEVVSLETMEELIKGLKIMGKETSDFALTTTKEELSKIKKTLSEFLGSSNTYYGRGDLSHFETINEILAKFTPSQTITRNRRMAERSKPYLEKGDALLAVGICHFPGEQGLITKLREQNYKIKKYKT